MAIRVVDNKGVADTQAELLAAAADYPPDTVVYCADTKNTFTKV